MKLSHSVGSERAFFDLWRTELVAAMTLVDDLPEGQLYYYRSPYSCDVWVVVGPQLLFVAYPIGDDPDEIRNRVRGWHNALKERRKLVGSIGDVGQLVYAAEYDPTADHVVVTYFKLGDWCGFALEHNRPLPKDWHQLPRRWPESYRDRITELAAQRVVAAPGGAAGA